MVSDSEVKEIFVEDVREKKKAGSGVYGRAGKGGRTRNIRMPSDLLTGKEKSEYIKGGEVKTTKMAIKVMPWEDFRAMNFQDQRKTLMFYRKKFTNESIRDTWGLSTYQYYTKLMKKELGIIPNRKRKKMTLPDGTDSPKVVVVHDGFTYSTQGIYSSDEIKTRLEKLVTLMEIETGEYEINLTLIEKKKPDATETQLKLALDEYEEREA